MQSPTGSSDRQGTFLTCVISSLSPATAAMCMATVRFPSMPDTIYRAAGSWMSTLERRKSRGNVCIRSRIFLIADGELWCFLQFRRPVVLDSWVLWAAHVRTNHVHVVAEAEVRPELLMNAFKSYASRALNRAGFDFPDRKRWTKHGSTVWLWSDRSVSDAMRYVAYEQGEAMALFLRETERRSLTVTTPSEVCDGVGVCSGVEVRDGVGVCDGVGECVGLGLRWSWGVRWS